MSQTPEDRRPLGQTVRPAPQPVTTWLQAEQNAARWVKAWGFKKVKVTPGGPDHGIDVTGAGVKVQVKHLQVPVGEPDIRRFLGARRSDSTDQMLFFAKSGYTGPAQTAAMEGGVCLFRYDEAGVPYPENKPARKLCQTVGHKWSPRRTPPAKQVVQRPKRLHAPLKLNSPKAVGPRTLAEHVHLSALGAIETWLSAAGSTPTFGRTERVARVGDVVVWAHRTGAPLGDDDVDAFIQEPLLGGAQQFLMLTWSGFDPRVLRYAYARDIAVVVVDEEGDLFPVNRLGRDFFI